MDGVATYAKALASAVIGLAVSYIIYSALAPTVFANLVLANTAAAAWGSGVTAAIALGALSFGLFIGIASFAILSKLF